MFNELIGESIPIYRGLLILENPLSTMLHITKGKALFMVDEPGFAAENFTVSTQPILKERIV